jgi:hypothetical protein
MFGIEISELTSLNDNDYCGQCGQIGCEHDGRDAEMSQCYDIEYTVIGVHDNGRENRFAEAYSAASPADAEARALVEHPALLIAAVVEGPCKAVA